ncbi:RNA-directed DNA polymerase, eukaryota [Tanacetum coccineum]|uniref:RNA-directed DNA polymerase, eukaryota n=1 Tax=Tanacetum coccineum TaxID=301880 RepID=A0ABQ4Z2X7_9ASTR
MDDFSPQGSKEREDGEIQATPNNNNMSSYNHEKRREGEDNGWKTVDRRRRKAHTKQETTTSYFFTDIPPGWNEVTLWKTFAKFGRVFDVYMAKKRRLMGKILGLPDSSTLPTQNHLKPLFNPSPLATTN